MRGEGALNNGEGGWSSSDSDELWLVSGSGIDASSVAALAFPLPLGSAFCRAAFFAALTASAAFFRAAFFAFFAAAACRCPSVCDGTSGKTCGMSIPSVRAGCGMGRRMKTES